MIQLQELACYCWNFPSLPTRRPWAAVGGDWCTWRGRAAPPLAVWQAGSRGSEYHAEKARRPSLEAWTVAPQRAALQGKGASTFSSGDWRKACSSRARLSGVRSGTWARKGSSQQRGVSSACSPWGPPAPSASRAPGLPASGRTCRIEGWSRWPHTCWASWTPCNSLGRTPWRGPWPPAWQEPGQTWAFF